MSTNDPSRPTSVFVITPEFGDELARRFGGAQGADIEACPFLREARLLMEALPHAAEALTVAARSIQPNAWNGIDQDSLRLQALYVLHRLDLYNAARAARFDVDAQQLVPDAVVGNELRKVRDGERAA